MRDVVPTTEPVPLSAAMVLLLTSLAKNVRQLTVGEGQEISHRHQHYCLELRQRPAPPRVGADDERMISANSLAECGFANRWRDS